jgi:hypothetical protein
MLKQSVEQIQEETQQSLTTQEEFVLEDDSIITDEYFEKSMLELDEMNFVEIKKVNKEFLFQKDSLEKAKVSVNQIMELRKMTDEAAQSDSSLANAIMDADMEVSTGVEDITKFLESYDDTMNKLNKLIERSEELIHKFDDVEKTTKYLTENMLQIIDKNIARLKKDDSNTMKHLLIYYNEVRNIFSNRDSVDFLLEKIGTKNIEVRRLKTSLKKDKYGSVLAATQKKVVGLFTGIFNANQMAVAEEYLTKLFGNENEAFYFQYVLALIYERERTHGKYGKQKWVEVLFMNVMDIATGIYDLDSGKEYYDTQLLKLRDELVKII